MATWTDYSTHGICHSRTIRRRMYTNIRRVTVGCVVATNASKDGNSTSGRAPNYLHRQRTRQRVCVYVRPHRLQRAKKTWDVNTATTFRRSATGFLLLIYSGRRQQSGSRLSDQSLTRTLHPALAHASSATLARGTLPRLPCLPSTPPMACLHTVCLSTFAHAPCCWTSGRPVCMPEHL